MGGWDIQQGYDGDRQRVKKTEGGQTILYLRSTALGGQVVAEYNQSGTWLRGYVYDGGGQLLAMQAGWVEWVHQDPVTKSKRVTDRWGNSIATIDVDPWGGETSRMENGGALPYKYTTYERDGNGRDQAMQRSYHAWFSRFDQPDPYDGSYDLTNPQTLNRYAYVGNDPINFVDPSGLETVDARHARLGREARERLNSMGREIDLGFGRRGPYRLEDPRGFIPQNHVPPIDADAIRSELQRMLANPDCANFIKEIIDRTSSAVGAKSPLVEGGDILKIFNKILSQGGIVRSGQPGSQLGGTQANGFISRGDAQIQLGIYQGGAPTAAQVRQGDGRMALAETLHHAGSNVYYDYDYAKAISQIPGMPVLPKGTGDPYNKDRGLYSNYFHPEVYKRCK